MRDLGFVLKEHKFFKDLKPEYLDLLIGCASNVRVKAGEVILKEGDPADHFYLIREGMVAIEIMVDSQHPITIQTIDSGDILGWSWLIPPHRSRFNCRAIQDTLMISLDGNCLRGKCEENHDLGYEILRRLASVFTQRLEATRFQLLNLIEGERKE